MIALLDIGKTFHCYGHRLPAILPVPLAHSQREHRIGLEAKGISGIDRFAEHGDGEALVYHMGTYASVVSR